MLLDEGSVSFSVCGHPVAPALFVEKTLLSPMNGLGALSETTCLRMQKPMPASLSRCTGLYVRLNAAPHCLDDCTFVAGFESTRRESSSLVPVFQGCLG